jgi:hypothetical protein
MCTIRKRCSLVGVLPLLVLSLPVTFGREQNGPSVEIRVNNNEVIRTIQGGIGASWHAIEAPILGRSADGEVLGGSAWGANPPAEDKAAWQALYRHANWLGLDWCRVELEQRMYEPKKREFDWDNAEMRILYRILDWAEKRKSDVFLQQMWSNVEWNAYPEMRDNPDRRLVSAPLSLAEKRLAEWSQWAHVRNKPLFLSEVGSQIYGFKDSDAGPGTYEAGLKDASLVVRGLRVGVDGFNRWSFMNRGDLDGQWQLVDTWDIPNQRLSKTFRPHPNSYYLIGLLSRFTAKHSEVLATHVEGGSSQGIQHVIAVALRSPRGQHTLLVVNEVESDWDASIVFQGLKKSATLYQYRMTPQQRDQSNLSLQADNEFRVTKDEGRFRVRIPGRSVTVYSTYQLGPQDEGIISE